MSVDDVSADSDRKKNRYHFDRHTPEYRLQFDKITEEMQPSARWRGPTYLQRALGSRGQQARLRVGALSCRVQRSRHQRRTQRIPGHHDPQGAAGHGRARRHSRDGRTRAQHLPRCTEPLPVPRRDQAVAALRRRDRAGGPRREDRVGPHRLRRRPRQHRARGAHPGDDGHRARQVADLQRACAPVGVHPRALARRRRASPR